MHLVEERIEERQESVSDLKDRLAGGGYICAIVGRVLGAVGIAIVVPVKCVESSQFHPSLAELGWAVIEVATYICSNLQSLFKIFTMTQKRVP